MTPTEQIAYLQSQINVLIAQVNQLTQSNTLPRNVEDTITERLNIGSFLTATGTGSAGGQTTYAAFPVFVPANPSGTIAVSFNGTIYNLLYK